MYELAGWSLNGPQRSPRAHFGPHFIRCNERKKMAKGAAAIFTVSGETIIKGGPKHLHIYPLPFRPRFIIVYPDRHERALIFVFPSWRRLHACVLPAFYNIRGPPGAQFDASGCPHIVSEHWVLNGGHYKQSPHLILYNIQLRAVSHFLFFITRFQFSFYWQQRQPEACILVLTYYCCICYRLYLLIMCGTHNL